MTGETGHTDTAEWLAANSEPIERTRSLGEAILNLATLETAIRQRTQIPEIQEATRQYLGMQQLDIFPELVSAHQAVPYGELIERRERADAQLEATAGQLALVESGMFEEAAVVRADAALVAESIPELAETMNTIAQEAIELRQKKKLQLLTHEQQEATNDREQLEGALADAGFIPLPMLATPEQQQGAYRTARIIMGIEQEAYESTEQQPPEEPSMQPAITEVAGNEREAGPGRTAGTYLALRPDEPIDIADVAEVVYGERTGRAVKKLDALVHIAQLGGRTPLTEQLAACGLQLRRERHPLPMEGPGKQRFRILLRAIPIGTDPKE